MKLLVALFIAAIFVVTISSNFRSNTPSNPNNANNINASFSPQKGNPLSLGWIPRSMLSNIRTPQSPNPTTPSTNPTPDPNATLNPNATPTPTPSSQNPTPTPLTLNGTTPTPTARSTSKPTPTIANVPVYCQSNNLTTDGRLIINAKAAGAKGDGVTDDRNFIQNALNCFKNDPKGGVIYIPAGTYNLSRRLVVYSNEIIFGDDTTSGQNFNSQTILKLLTTKDFLIFNDRALGTKNIGLMNLTLIGQGIDDLSAEGERCCAGIEFHNLTGGFIANIVVEGFNDNGIHFDRYITETKGVTNVIISNCKAINNKRSGIAINNGTDNVVNNCFITGNNKGENSSSWGTNKGDAALNIELGKSGIIARNKVIRSTVSSNGIYSANQGGGINVGRATSTRGNSSYILEDNVICNNTVENNGDVGISEANGNRDIYIANVIRNNRDRNDGKIVICDEDKGLGNGGCQNYGNTAYEDERSNATHPSCDITASLNTIPSLPQKPSVQGISISIWDQILGKIKAIF